MSSAATLNQSSPSSGLSEVLTSLSTGATSTGSSGLGQVITSLSTGASTGAFSTLPLATAPLSSFDMASAPVSMNPMMSTGAIDFSTGATGAIGFSTGATGPMPVPVATDKDGKPFYYGSRLHCEVPGTPPVDFYVSRVDDFGAGDGKNIAIVDVLAGQAWSKNQCSVLSEPPYGPITAQSFAIDKTGRPIYPNSLVYCGKGSFLTARDYEEKFNVSSISNDRRLINNPGNKGFLGGLCEVISDPPSGAFSSGTDGAMGTATGMSMFGEQIDIKALNDTLNNVVQRLELIQKIVPGISDADLMAYMAQPQPGPLVMETPQVPPSSVGTDAGDETQGSPTEDTSQNTPSENSDTPQNDPPSENTSENNMGGGGKKKPKRKTRRRNKRGLNSTR